MKILVVGLDCAAPEILFHDERLTNLRRLMEHGCYGSLESVIPPITVPAWMCMATSQDPGSLGVYGFRNRADHSYSGVALVNSRSFRELTLWDQVAIEGGRSVLLGVPPSFPPRKVNGISVGCFLTPDPARDEYTHPPSVKDEIAALVGEYPVDVKGFRTDDKIRLRDQIYGMTDKHFRVARHYLERAEWDYFQAVEIGVDRIHHGFWKHHDPRHEQHEAASRFATVISDYYAYLDHELGRLLDLLDEETIVLVLSDHGARALDGGFCVNEWLARNKLLALRTRPRAITPFAGLDVDWSKTRAWSEGGYCGRVFLNVRGREPMGVVEPGDYEAMRNDLKSMLESTIEGTLVFKPEEIYQDVRNIAPDLIVHFGGLAWRSIGSVGHESVRVRGNDTGPDDCNHSQFGAFILASPNNPLRGEIEGARLLDMAPTVLELAGHDIPSSMQGRSLVAGYDSAQRKPPPATANGEDAVRERLRGLGYLS